MFLALGLIAILGAVVFAVTWWMNRRWDLLDGYRNPERQCPPIIDAGPPIFDVCDWLNGGSVVQSRT